MNWLMQLFGSSKKEAAAAKPQSAIGQGNLAKTARSHINRIRSTMKDARMKSILDEVEKCFVINAPAIEDMVQQTILDRKLHTKSIEGGGMKTWLVVSAVPRSRVESAAFFASEYPPGYGGYMNFWLNSQLAKMANTIGHSVMAHLLVYADRSIGLGLTPLDLTTQARAPCLCFLKNQ